MGSKSVTKDVLTPEGRKFLAQMAALKSKPRVKVGILSKDFGTEKIADSTGSQTAGDVTVGEVAVWAEFGTLTEPERSWLRATVDKKWKDWGKFADDLRWQMVHRGMTTDTALGRMGARIQADLKDAIRSDIPPPNAPATLAAKFPKTHTLINTGQFLNSVAWELMKAEEKGTGGYRPIGAE